MSKKFHKKHAKLKEGVKKAKQLLFFARSLSKGNSLLAIAGVILLSIVLGIWYVINAYNQNNAFGFALDDPWIHLTFAKNLIEYGAYSYFKNEVVTSGSTSPLYTSILALFYLIIKNEFILSYFLGISFLALSVYFIYKIVKIDFPTKTILGISAAILIAIQPKLSLISVSGMETVVFIFTVISATYFYKKMNALLTGVFLGLAVWTRPEGLILWIAIILDYLYKNFVLSPVNKSEQPIKLFTKRQLTATLSIGLGLIGFYFIFNYALSSSLLPNSYAAKIEYYFGSNRENFLKRDVLEYFSKGEFILIWFLFCLGFVQTIIDIFRRKYNPILIFVVFTIGLIAVYYIKLPFAHRFGRYLMPVIPFFVLTATYTIANILEFIQKRAKSDQSFGLNFLFALFIAVTIFFSIDENSKYINETAEVWNYHNVRHVAIANWLKNHTPPDAVIATHDIGALAYYSDRRIVDMVGLINPEVISHLNEKDFTDYMRNYFLKNNVSYFASIRNWFEAVNQKPVYVPINEFEYFEVFKFEPDKLYFQPKEVSHLNEQAIFYLQNKQPQNAIQILKRSISIDPKSSRTHFLLGSAYELIRDNNNAEREFQKALEIFPELADGYYGLGKIAFNLQDYQTAKANINRCLQLDPDYAPAIQLMVMILENAEKNPTAALPLRQRLTELLEKR
jgi:tetratricopeptide (TPR) repeat protein